MKAILGGKFESALIRAMDEANRPHFNRITHPYYLGLNRRSDSSFFDRGATFVAIADEIIVPQADWSPSAEGPNGVDGKSLGVRYGEGTFKEWDENARSFASVLLGARALSSGSLNYISEMDLTDLSKADREKVNEKLDDIKQSISEQYLCRLFLQIREAGKEGSLIILDERDITLLSEVCDYIRGGGPPPSFSLPELNGQVILGQKFVGGLLNFSPHDAASVAAIRADKTIQRYAEKVRSFVTSASSLEGERALLDAMRETYDVVRAERKIENVFEVVSWLAKPLHYLPGVDAALSIAEDTKDVASLLIGKEEECREWYLLGARAQQINIEKYLERKKNM